jgi:tRNA 2-thiocytidine biosynthesis protein TtcA
MIDFLASLYRKVGRAVSDYGMIQEGDRILVALSGGKDSFTLLDALRRLQTRAPVKFSLVACTVNPGFPLFSTAEIEEYLRHHGYEYEIVQTGIYEKTFRDKENAPDGCFHCSRLRRSVLYRTADSRGCGKIAIGHHREDFIETVLLSMMYNGRIETMLPILKSGSGKFTIIRPLMYVYEETTKSYAAEKRFPVTCCYCPLYESTAIQHRKKVKRMLAEFEKGDREIKNVLLRALSHFQGPRMLDLRYNEPLKSLIAEGKAGDRKARKKPEGR